MAIKKFSPPKLKTFNGNLFRLYKIGNKAEVKSTQSIAKKNDAKTRILNYKYDGRIIYVLYINR
jgi:hypothetical protein